MKINRTQLRRMILKEMRLLTEAEEHKLEVLIQSRRGTPFTVKKSGDVSLILSYPQSTPRKVKISGYDEDGNSIYSKAFDASKTIDVKLDAGDYRIKALR